MQLLFAALAIMGVPQAEDLGRKIEGVLPRPEEERWLRVGWEPNLMRARAESQRAGRPLLVWVMDGDVLGST